MIILNHHAEGWVQTSASSLPASFLYALVHRTLRGLRFILKFLWHFERQKLKTCALHASLYRSEALRTEDYRGTST